MSEASGRKPSKRELREIEEANRQKRRLLIGGAAATVVTVAVGGAAYLTNQERAKPKNLREEVLTFTWEMAKQPDQLQKFAERLAEGYIETTKSPRVTKAGLTGPGMLNFYHTRQDFINGVRTVSPTFSPDQVTATSNLHSVTNHSTSKVFIDLNSLREQNSANPQSAGTVLLGDLWHEWGHVDITEKTIGERINNPAYFFKSPNSGKDELLRRYYGGSVLTDTYFGFIRFEEVWNDTNTIALVKQAANLDIAGLADYRPNGTNFFPKLLAVLNITPNQSYSMHAASDFEGFAKLIGEKLPGNAAPLEKGVRLFIGIHDSNTQLIEQTGALGLIK